KLAIGSWWLVAGSWLGRRTSYKLPATNYDVRRTYMGFFDNLKNQVGSQFIEIIEWLEDTNDTLVYRFPYYNQEIKMRAQLIVRENQVALFINEGQAADLFK